MVAQQAFGEAFEPKNFPPPNRDIETDGCRYRYRQSAFYLDGKPSPLEGIHTSDIIYIRRDKTFSREDE